VLSIGKQDSLNSCFYHFDRAVNLCFIFLISLLLINYLICRGDYFLFNLIFIYKKNQIEFFFKKNRNWFKPTGFSSVRFGFLRQNPVQIGLARFFSGLTRFFSVWVRFSLVFSVLGL
jgi:hypothetical protein